MISHDDAVKRPADLFGQIALAESKKRRQNGTDDTRYQRQQQRILRGQQQRLIGDHILIPFCRKFKRQRIITGFVQTQHHEYDDRNIQIEQDEQDENFA